MYCSRCGKKVLDSMLYCPFCGAEIIIPEQESRDGEYDLPPEPVKVQPVFSFDIPDEPESVEAPEPQTTAEGGTEEREETGTRLPWEEGAGEIPTPAQTPEIPAEKSPAESPEAVENERPVPESRQVPDVVPGRRTNETLVPDKAPLSMFMDEADDFDREADDLDDDENDDFDDFEEEMERQARRSKRGRSRKARYEDEDSDDDGEDRSFVSRHIRGIVGILLFLVLLAILAFYVLTDSGQLALAKINATLPLRPDIYSRIAYDYYQSEDYAQSGVYYERALARDADSYNYASSAAMAYIAAGDNDKAAEMLRKCVQLNPDAVEPYVYLMNLYPNAASRPWDVEQLLRQGYQRTGDNRLATADNDGARS